MAGESPPSTGLAARCIVAGAASDASRAGIAAALMEVIQPAAAAPVNGRAARGASRYARCMCRNIRTLHNFEPAATDEEIRASALVRKISGSTKPSRANIEAFERAVDAVTAASERLLSELVTAAPPRDREVEAAKAKARAAQRYAA